MTGVLQAVRVVIDFALFEVLLQVLGILVGGLVVYQALRGYRRNDSRAMLFLGAGLLVLGPIHFAVAIVPAAPVLTGLAIQLLDVLGLGLILYSLTRA